MSYQNHFTDFGPGARGIVANTANGTIRDCWGDTDRISNIEVIWGSHLADQFKGSAGWDRFQGLRGADTLDGAGGDRDEARYDQDHRWGGTRGIVADLQVSAANGEIRGTIRDGFGETDTVIDIERVYGTRHNDKFAGSDGRNWFDGIDGIDTFNGRGGFDIVSFLSNDFSGAQSGVRVDLSQNRVLNDGFGNAERLTAIEGIVGSGRNDTLLGGGSGDYLEGSDGADRLTGRGGNDNFGYYDGIGTFGDTITDFRSGRDNFEFGLAGFAGMTANSEFRNGTSAGGSGSWFFYNAANDGLFWDRDGTGTRFDPLLVATLPGVAALSEDDFLFF